MYIAFYYKMLQDNNNKIFTKTNYVSMLYSILFSLGIGFLSPEFFSIGLAKGLCEGLQGLQLRGI